MVQSQLNAYSGSDPVWGFVALVGSELFTGEAAVGLDPRVRLFAVDGRIYFAEREDDPPLGTRLVNCGAISAMQLARGAVQASGQQSLARLFQRDATVDRDAVELTIQVGTETLLATIANSPVGMPEVFPLSYHSTGIHHWLRSTQPATDTEEVVADEPVVDEPIVDEPIADEPIVAEPIADEPVVAEPIVAEPIVAEPIVAEPVVAEPVVAEPIAVEPIVAEPIAVEPVEPITPEPLTVPVLATRPAPSAPVESAVPEWPRVDDEPGWEIPPAPVDAPQIVEPVAKSVLTPLLAPVVAPTVVAAQDVEPQVIAPLVLELPDLELQVVELQVVELPAVELPADELPADELPADELKVDELQVEALELVPAVMGLPKLAALHSISNFAPDPVLVAKSEPTPNGESNGVDGSPLPKLATSPVSMNDLKESAAASESWGNTSNNMAAVQIWEMVDDLFEDPKEEIRVGGGAPQERGRGWLRKKT